MVKFFLISPQSPLPKYLNYFSQCQANHHCRDFASRGSISSRAAMPFRFTELRFCSRHRYSISTPEYCVLNRHCLRFPFPLALGHLTGIGRPMSAPLALGATRSASSLGSWILGRDKRTSCPLRCRALRIMIASEYLKKSAWYMTCKQLTGHKTVTGDWTLYINLIYKWINIINICI